MEDSEGGAMKGYDVVTVDDQKVGTVVGESGEYLIVEQGAIRKSKHALPREFTHVDEAEQLVRMTVPKAVFCDSPKVNGEADYPAIAEHYGLASTTPAPGAEGYGETAPGDPSRSSEQEGARAGVTPAAEERAGIREGRSDREPALLGEQLTDAKRKP
jgi:hypothetical protein